MTDSRTSKIQMIASDILDMEEKIEAMVKNKKRLESLLLEATRDELSTQLADKDYGCGTANIKPDGFRIKVTISKKVSYDQKGLKTIADHFAARGINPGEYMKIKYDIPEASYKAWPESLQKMFEPHRTVEPSTPKIEIERA